MKKEFKDYYVGLDVGTSSVGWAVTDSQYNILKTKGKSMWGVRLFNEADTAQDRRTHRSERRRTQRRKQRISLLQELFAAPISEVDDKFFIRLKESKYWPEDKLYSGNQKNTLFNDEGFTDKDYHKKYKSIYHLRKMLIEGDEESLKDPRLVYLACHHILKHRGHFLFKGELNAVLNDISDELRELNQLIVDEYGIAFVCKDIDAFSEDLKNPKLNKSEKKKLFKKYFVDDDCEDKKLQIAFTELLAGSDKKTTDFISVNENEDEEPLSVKVSFSSGDFEEKVSEIEEALGDKILVIQKMKAIYDWGILAQILKGNQYISYAKVDVFEKHKNDLNLLKNVIKNGTTGDEYKLLFNLKGKDFLKAFKKEKGNKEKAKILEANYCAYIGDSLDICSYEDFTKNINNILKNVIGFEDEIASILSEIESKEFLPKQVIKDNGVIPHQVHLNELKKILENAAKYHSFLNEKDEYGTVADKIVSILTFRIPYYVGPINTNNKEAGFCWAKVAEHAKVRPWNFDDVVDKEASAEEFISRMTNQCVYLPWADVLPKQSVLYQTYMVLNELNNLKIDDIKLGVEQKQEIFENLFKIKGKVSNRDILSFMKQQGYLENNSKKHTISGIDGAFKSSMSSYCAFKRILKDKDVKDEIIEEIIKLSTIFGSEKEMLVRKLHKDYGNILNDKEIKEIKGLNFNGWARFSREFLTEITDVNKETGEYECILKALYNRQDNLMQLLGNDNDFSSNIEKVNKEKCGMPGGELTYDKVDELYASPAVKRGIWQAVSILMELKKITGKEPAKVFIEMARGADNSGRKDSRKTELDKLYKNAKKDVALWNAQDVMESINDKTDQQLRSKKLYLWYTQMGKCMYSGEAIHLEDLLYSNTKYDIDHIYPQSKIDDDSIRNNTVLVKKEYNAKKGNEYPLPSDWRKDRAALWDMLKKNKLITEEKWKRLNRNFALTEGELADFAARQLVETRQSTKEIARLIDEHFEATKVVYVKAAAVSNFRQGVDDTVYGYKAKSDEEKAKVKDIISQRQDENRFIKCRSINDFHHAKDAYLNIVVGNVYSVKYTNNPLNFIREKIKKEEFEKHSIKALYKFKVVRNDEIAWIPSDENEGTMATVKKYMRRNDVLFTRLAFEKKHGQNGGLFDQNIVGAKEGLQPIKASDSRLHNTERYGGYNTVTPAYFILVAYENKRGETVKRMETLPLYMKNRFENDDEYKEVVLMKFAENNKLKNPRILIDKIKFNTLIDYNGFRMHLTGNNEKYLMFWNANQLVLSREYEEYIKKLENYERKLKDNKEATIGEFDGISHNLNVELYREFINKIEKSVYGKRFSGVSKILKNGFDTFIILPLEKQAVALLGILNLFICKAKAADLSLIGGKGRTMEGMPLSKNLNKDDDISIINQSITGLYENRIEINKL